MIINNWPSVRTRGCLVRLHFQVNHFRNEFEPHQSGFIGAVSTVQKAAMNQKINQNQSKSMRLRAHYRRATEPYNTAWLIETDQIQSASHQRRRSQAIENR